MTTLVVSDLHLGARSGIDLLAREPVRAALLEAVGEADELVLLGDMVELRDGPMVAALEAARPVFEALGDALGQRRVVLVPGNHDHRLLEDWRQRRRERAAAAAPLGLEQRCEPAQASSAAAALAGWLAPARVNVAYPGVWLADGAVYATHGHYLDRHLTVPAFEPLAVHAVERLLRARGDGLVGVEGYEAVLSPIYAALHELAQTAPAADERRPAAPSASGRAYRMLAGEERGWRALRHQALGGVAFPAVVAALNRAGLGPLRADLSGPELRRSSLRAMGEVVGRLGVRAEHVIFGHTHRAGPRPIDDEEEWRAPTGTQLHNSGTWAVERFLGGSAPQDSPYRAGGSVWVADDGVPRARNLLDGVRRP